MKGLLLKEFYTMYQYCRALLFIVCMFIVFAFVNTENIFFTLYPIIISSMVPMTLLSYDEKERWDKYSLSLPYTRAQLVSSKYLSGLIANLAIIILFGIALFLKNSFSAAGSSDDILTTLQVMLTLCLFGPALVMPFVFKLGTDKGRLAYYFCIAILFAVGAVLTLDEPSLPDFVVRYGNSLILLLSIGIYIGSWILSIRFYEKREF
ncbi:MAG: ABC-2 transporter permease [Lachnospiraceae bacterium]